MSGKNAGDFVVAPGDATEQLFAATGTWTKTTGARAYWIRVVGSGGGSGGCNAAGTGNAESGGGGGGGYGEDVILASALGATETVTVGAGGTAGASGGGTGGTGGTVSFGAHIVALGGAGGVQGLNTTVSHVSVGGLGGTCSGGSVNIQGGTGSPGIVQGGVVVHIALGGGTPLGFPAAPANAFGTPVNGQLYGGGAAGTLTSTVATAGGVGGKGCVIVVALF